MAAKQDDSIASNREFVQLVVVVDDQSSSTGLSLEKAVGNEPNTATPPYITGWRLHLTTIGIALSLFLVNLEVTIVSTSLVGITNDLGGFNETSWIVSGYLITYTAFIILWAKISDILGRKSTLLTCLLIFIALSGGCAASATLDQLIVCRTFQGVGGAGVYALAVLITYEMVPKEKLPLYGSMNSLAVTIATLMGPICGGLINNNTTWRWVFYLNLPVGFFAMATLVLGIPQRWGSRGTKQYRKSLGKLDILGAVLLLTGSLLLVTALLEASTRYSWSSALCISLLTLSGLGWIGFCTWEWYITSSHSTIESVFPWYFVKNRVVMGILISSFLAGAPFNVAVITIPQRLQAVCGMTPLEAGIHLLPYTVGAALGAVAANVAGSKRKLAVVHILLFGTLLQVLGLAFLSTLPATSEFPSKGYGFEVLAGFGLGVTFGCLVLTTPFVVDQTDLAVATGAVIQFRFLGGVIGLAIASSVMNDTVAAGLKDFISPGTLTEIFQNASTLISLPPSVQAQAVEVFAEGYDLQFKIVSGFAAAQLLATMMLWKRAEQIKVG